MAVDRTASMLARSVSLSERPTDDMVVSRCLYRIWRKYNNYYNNNYIIIMKNI